MNLYLKGEKKRKKFRSFWTNKAGRLYHFIRGLSNIVIYNIVNIFEIINIKSDIFLLLNYIVYS